MWHHPATVKARLRRWSGLVFRPVAVAFDPRLEGLEHRVVERIESRLEAMERHVASDAEVTAEMTITQSRLLARLESRLAALEERLAVPVGSRALVAAWVLGGLAGLRVPARIGVAAAGDAGLAMALAGLGHEVVLLGGGAEAVEHPRIRRDGGGGAAQRDLDAAVVVCAEGTSGPAPVDGALTSQAVARLGEGGLLLLAAPQSQAGALEALLGGLDVEERAVAVRGPSGVWEVARDGAAGADGVALLRAAAPR